MRTILIVFLTCAVLTGCRNGSTSSVTPLSGGSPTPPFVLRLADAYAGSLSGQQDRDDIKEDFRRNFFRGFTMPGAAVSGGTAASQGGFLAGQEYRRSNPTKIKETMEGFGYTAVDAAGVWTVSFEHSGFRPRNQPTQTWWLSYFGETLSNLPKNTEIPDEGVHIRVTGYLSPSGNFGHLNGYDHEFFATSISKTGD